MRFPRTRLATLVFATLASGLATVAARGQQLADYEIGYTEFRTNLPGGRHPNVATNRACLVRADGTDRRVLVA
ncbi:MAG: hypothetical protein JW818_19595, partial [Pirellulales bacterium]|nr:hypothetical protein [Pirellulales bacterium]